MFQGCDRLLETWSIEFKEDIFKSLKLNLIFRKSQFNPLFLAKNIFYILQLVLENKHMYYEYEELEHDTCSTIGLSEIRIAF